jgi:hypothetical protein
MKTSLQGSLQQMAQCGKSSTGERGRFLIVHLYEEIQSHTDKSILAEQTYEEGYRVGWDEARILESEVTAGTENGPYGMLN